MDFELWWLLPIPALFFGLGWIAARIDIKHLLRESRALPLSYFRGLNFLLNEQPDKAIESFIEVVKVDPQTIDLHFALGNLFRRQGEIDRAIRMHQNLLERPDLPAELSALVTRMLAKEPAQRPDAARVAAALLKIHDQIDQIVRPVRGTRWQTSQPGDREVRRQLRLVLRNNHLPVQGDLFDRAYAYIKEHY